MLHYCGDASRCGCIIETQERRVWREESKMRGFPHSYEPEEAMKVELWVGVTPSGWSLVIRIPMKWDPEGSEAKGRGLNIKRYQAQ
ncbi:MAG: hypothetical protein QXF42_03760 [Sulfolobales archaeon]